MNKALRHTENVPDSDLERFSQMFSTLTPSTTASVTADSILPQEGQAVLQALEHDWRKMCGNSANPAPLGPDPFRMDLALPYTFILQRTAPGSARIRVAGQRLHEMAQFDPRGLCFGTFFSDGARETALELVDACLTLPAIVRIPLHTSRGFGRKPLRSEALLLPLRDAQGGLSRVMGAIVSETSLRLKAHRWDIDPKRALRCDALEGAFPDRRKGPRTTPSMPAQRGLRLVVDNTTSLEDA